VELENTGEAEKDTVADVQPSGTPEEGDTVTVSYWGKPLVPVPSESTKHGKGKGKG
jgi:serine/threonine-protein kinase